MKKSFPSPQTSYLISFRLVLSLSNLVRLRNRPFDLVRPRSTSFDLVFAVRNRPSSLSFASIRPHRAHLWITSFYTLIFYLNFISHHSHAVEERVTCLAYFSIIVGFISAIVYQHIQCAVHVIVVPMVSHRTHPCPIFHLCTPLPPPYHPCYPKVNYHMTSGL